MSQSDEKIAPPGEAYCPSCDRSFDSSLKVCPHDGTRLVDLSRPADPMIGRQIDGRFTIRERLGAGGMGVVYRAWQASVGREVAIKVIAPRPGDDSSTAKRFLREAKLASQLAQPNIVMVIDFGATSDGTLYLAMELLRGRTLSQVVRKDGPFTPPRMLRVVSQLCDALDSAHRAGIIHRDLKPANVMILDEPAGRDFVKVLDFGLAKALDGEHETTLTQSDRVVGTPSYMAPEVITGSAAEARSDLYSLGVMIYEMLTGRLPFAAPNANVMLAKHAYAPIPELDGVPDQVARVVKKLLAKQPEQRYGTAAELHAAFEKAVAGKLPVDPPSDQALVETRDASATSPTMLAALAETVSSQPVLSITAPAPAVAPTPAATPTPMPARSRRPTIAILLVVIAAAIGAAIAIMASKTPREETPAAEPEAAPAPAAAPDAAAAMVAAPDAAAAAPVVDAGVTKKKDRDRKDRDKDRKKKIDAGPVIELKPPPVPIDAAPPPPPRKIDAGPVFIPPE